MMATDGGHDKDDDDRQEETPLEKLMGLFQAKMQRIEALEEQVEQRVRRARRRLLALNPVPVRQTHQRMYISHSYIPEITNSGAMAALMKGLESKPSPPIWKLHIEGKLLVDHLDFEAADAFDANAKFKEPLVDDNVSKPNSISNNINSKQSSSSSKAEENAAEEAAADAKVRPPVKTSQLFYKITVAFQTIFAPIKASSASPSPAKKSKKPRRSSTSKTASSPAKGVDPDDPKVPSSKQVISYKCCEQPGADIWSFQYTEPPSPDPAKWKAESVVATVDLYRRFQYNTPTPPGREHKRYRIKSLVLQRSFFPNHGPVTTDALTGQKRNLRGDAAAATASASASTAADNNNNNEIPVHNEVHVPTSVRTILLYLLKAVCS
jgi:hypothetical protein